MTDSSLRTPVAVLIPAAGRGTRLGGERKQFRKLGEAPVLYQTARSFDAHPSVGELILAVPPAEVDQMERDPTWQELSKLKALVPGGRSRRASVAAALAAVSPKTELVLVHDAVRPFVSKAVITGVIDAARTHGAAAPAIPVADTLRSAQENWFGETVPRDRLYRIQTPQGFRRAWLEAAHRRAEQEGEAATDDVELVQRLGRRVRLVPGPSYNFKITTAADWTLARILWKHREHLD